MSISRRDFLKYCLSSAALLGLDSTALGTLAKALAAGGPNVIWLSGASCSGCTVSLANRIMPAGPVTDIADLLVNHISLAYHTTLMGAAGDQAVSNLKNAAAGSYVLAVEGGIPGAYGGHACVLWTEGGREVTALEAVKTLAARATAVLGIGTCACFGGIPGAQPNPTGILSVKAAIGKSVIHIPGCPTHPDWVVWTIAQLLAGKAPVLDAFGRPAELFKTKIHGICPRKGTTEVKTFGAVGCLKSLGCKGPKTMADCPTRRWNNAANWCIGANSVCLGCTESGFPDAFSPLVAVKT